MKKFGIKCSEHPGDRPTWMKTRLPSGKKEYLRFKTMAQARSWMRRHRSWITDFAVGPLPASKL